MPTRKTKLVVGEYYHLFSRGVDRRTIFETEADYKRFVRTLLYYLYNDRRGRFSDQDFSAPIPSPKQNSVPFVILAGFCLMPNHFHLLVRQEQENGISLFIHRVLNSYTHYFNLKHERRGSLFEGRFKSVHVETNGQLLHLSRYIHLNPKLAGMVDSVDEYPYSSYATYLNPDQNKHLNPTIVTDQFARPADYEKFVKDWRSFQDQRNQLKDLVLE